MATVTAGSGYLRPDLPAPPDEIRALPRFRGYPVPWFVVWLIDGDAVPAATPGAVAEFRVTAPGAAYKAYRNDLCWVCGGKLAPDTVRSFLIGPMCAVNRNNAEPPSHIGCAAWSAIACPFLARPHAHRRDNALPEGLEEPPGIALRRNPGVVAVWTVDRYWLRELDPRTGGMLFDLGDPLTVDWIAEGRDATRAEVEESIATGVPALREIAAQQAGGLEHLQRSLAAVYKWLPDADG